MGAEGLQAEAGIVLPFMERNEAAGCIGKALMHSASGRGATGICDL